MMPRVPACARAISPLACLIQAGTNDGSFFVRPMTKEEQLEQEKQAKERSRKEFETGRVDWEE